MFFLSTDLEENDEESRNISRRLYDANGFTRIAQYVLLGKGGARLFDELGIEPEIYHLNEAHGLAGRLPCACQDRQRGGSAQALRLHYAHPGGSRQ